MTDFEKTIAMAEECAAAYCDARTQNNLPKETRSIYCSGYLRAYENHQKELDHERERRQAAERFLRGWAAVEMTEKEMLENAQEKVSKMLKNPKLAAEHLVEIWKKANRHFDKWGYK